MQNLLDKMIKMDSNILYHKTVEIWSVEKLSAGFIVRKHKLIKKYLELRETLISAEDRFTSKLEVITNVD
jgi:hypothetical protein